MTNAAAALAAWISSNYSKVGFGVGKQNEVRKILGPKRQFKSSAGWQNNKSAPVLLERIH